MSKHMTRRQVAAKARACREEEARLDKISKLVQDTHAAKKAQPRSAGNKLPDLNRPAYAQDQPVYPSLALPPPKKYVKPDLSPEMAAREAKAQEETEAKRKRVAPICNKGGYVYITDDMDLTTLGRKV